MPQDQRFLDPDRAVADALDFLGVPRTSSASTPAIVDPERIAYEIFHTRFDLEDPAKAIAALERLFPPKADGSIAPSPAATAAQAAATRAPGRYGQWAIAASALEVFSGHAAATLETIRPLSKLIPAAGTCGHHPTIALIRASIATLDAEFERSEAMTDVVDNALKDLRSLLDALESRCGIIPQNVCTADDEAILTNHLQLVADLDTFETHWKAARDSAETSIGARLEKVRHLLAYFVVTLTRLRREVSSPVAWTVPLKGTDISAGQVWSRMHEYAGTIAPALIEQGGIEALGVIKNAFETFQSFLTKLDASAGDECAPQFQNSEVKAVVAELRCQVGHVVTATTVSPAAAPRSRPTNKGKVTP